MYDPQFLKFELKYFPFLFIDDLILYNVGLGTLNKYLDY